MNNLIEITEAVEECNTKMDIPGNLPIEIFHEVLLFLSPTDLHNGWNCCTKWRNHMNIESFWKRKCLTENYSECKNDVDSEFYRNFMKGFSHWRGVYMYNSKLRENWLNLKYTIKNIDAIPAEKIGSFYYFSGDIIVGSITLSTTLWVIDYRTGAVKNRFNPQCGANHIATVEIVDNRLIAVLIEEKHVDKKYNTTMHVNIWNIDTGELLTELKEEGFDKIDRSTVIIFKDLIALVSHPYAGYVYNIKTEVLEFERCFVSTICYYNEKIVTGNHGGTIVMMDLNYKELMTFKSCTDQQTITDIKMEGKYLVCLCETRIYDRGNLVQTCVWNIETKTKLYELQDVHTDKLRMFVNENRVCYVCGTYEEPIFKMCRLNTGECLFEQECGRIGPNDFLVMQQNWKDARALKMCSIITAKLVAHFDFESPRELIKGFFDNSKGRIKTKSKFIYFGYDFTVKPYKLLFRVVDFEARIKMEK